MVRLRLPELLGRRGMNPYRLAKLSQGRISLSTACRLARLRGRVQLFDARVLEALSDVLEVDIAELLERRL